MDIEVLADQIRQKMIDGSEMLKNPVTHTYVYEALRPFPDLLRVLIESPEKLMAELTRCLVYRFPFKPDGFAQIEAQLKPLSDIGTILDPEKFRDDVRISNDASCREKDVRKPLGDFKKELWQRIVKSDAE